MNISKKQNSVFFRKLGKIIISLFLIFLALMLFSLPILNVLIYDFLFHSMFYNYYLVFFCVYSYILSGVVVWFFRKNKAIWNPTLGKIILTSIFCFLFSLVYSTWRCLGGDCFNLIWVGLFYSLIILPLHYIFSCLVTELFKFAYNNLKNNFL